MATFLDIGLLQKFEIIFPFLLVLVVVWGVLSYSKFLGDNKLIHGIIALALAILVLFSDSIREVLNRIAPWFVLLIMFIFFLMLLSKMGGDTGAGVGEGAGWMKMTIVIIALIILLFTIVDVMVWDEDTQTAGDIVTGGDVGEGGKASFFAVLRHPAVLGLIIILLIATFTIQKLAVEK